MKPNPTPTPFTPRQLLIANNALFEVIGVNLGAVGVTDLIALRPLSESAGMDSDGYKTKEVLVPSHILEMALNGGARLYDLHSVFPSVDEQEAERKLSPNYR